MTSETAGLCSTTWRACVRRRSCGGYGPRERGDRQLDRTARAGPEHPAPAPCARAARGELRRRGRGGERRARADPAVPRLRRARRDAADRRAVRRGAAADRGLALRLLALPPDRPRGERELLTFTSLSGIAEPGSAQFASLALLLALVVGALWLLVGLLRASVVAYLLSQRISWGSSRRSHRDRGFAAADRRSGRTRRRDRSCRSSGGC